MAGRVEGRTVAITGASSGIGEATAVALAREGAAVALGARRTDRIEELAQRIESDGGRAAAVRQAIEAMEKDIGDVLEAGDLADAILYVLAAAPRVAVNELLIRPAGQTR